MRNEVYNSRENRKNTLPKKRKHLTLFVKQLVSAIICIGIILGLTQLNIPVVDNCADAFKRAITYEVNLNDVWTNVKGLFSAD
ncbi:MAG: hypothetical protein RSB38_02425 [Oscillospiraceae bacterium]